VYPAVDCLHRLGPNHSLGTVDPHAIADVENLLLDVPRFSFKENAVCNCRADLLCGLVANPLEAALRVLGGESPDLLPLGLPNILWGSQHDPSKATPLDIRPVDLEVDNLVSRV